MDTTDNSLIEHEAFEASKEGYSFDRYGYSAWNLNIHWLVKQGITAKQAAGIMNSKVTRWAADSFETEGLHNAVERYYNHPRNFLMKDAGEFETT